MRSSWNRPLWIGAVAFACLVVTTTSAQEEAPVSVFGRRSSAAETGVFDMGTVPGSGRMSVEFRSVPAQEIADYVARIGRCNVLMSDDIDDTISIRFIADTPEEALRKLSLVLGASLERQALSTYRLVRLPRVSLRFEDTDVTTVIKKLAQLADGNVVVAEDVSGSISLQVDNVTWRSALDNVVRTAGFQVVEEDNGILRIVSIETLRRQRKTSVFPLRYVQPPQEYRPTIDTEFAVGGPQENETSRSFSGSGAAGGSTQGSGAQFPLLNAVADVLSPVGTVEYDSYSNALVVTDIGPRLVSAAKIIRLVDVRPQQVFIDVKFVSTSNSDLLDFGVNYQNVNGNPNLGFSIDINGGRFSTMFPFNRGEGGWFDGIGIVDDGPPEVYYDEVTGLPSPAGTFIPNNGGFAYGNLRFNQFLIILSFLKSDINTVVLQAPKILTLDNNEASIFVGRTVRYAETFSTSNQAGGVEVGIREAEDSPVDTGFQLLVIPHIVKGTDEILLELIPEDEALTGTGATIPGFDDFITGTSQIQLPRIGSRTIVTTVRIKSGHTAVIGGLVDERHSDTVRKIPFLGELPFIGWAFKSRLVQKDRNNLLIFVTAVIVRDDADIERIYTVHRKHDGGTVTDLEQLFQEATFQQSKKQLVQRDLSQDSADDDEQP